MPDVDARPSVAYPSIRDAARAAYHAGLSVVPPREDGTKAPWVDTWTIYTKTRASNGQMRAWYGPCRGIGMVCGAVSGNLEVLDFDDRAAYDEFVELAHQAGLGEVITRIERGYCEDSPKLGVHWLYRCDEIGGNQKLAKRRLLPEEKRSPDDRIKTLIETRGEGGYIVVAPSGGAVHETGRPYVLRSGGFDTIVTITPAERQDLHQMARALNEVPPPEPANSRQKPSTAVTSNRPGDEYAAQATWDDVLTGVGWCAVYTRGEVTHWRRPGKTHGTSATTNIHGSDLLYVFSGSTPFETDRGYGKFGAYAVLYHNGDYAAAAKALADAGFGAAHVPTPQPDPTAPPGAPSPTVQDDPPADAPPEPLLEPLSTVLGRFLDDLDSDTPPVVVATPFPGLNALLNGGFSVGELIYLGARPSVGKSSIALDIAREASKQGAVLVISREMVNLAVARRLVAQQGHVNAANLKTKTLSGYDRGVAADTAMMLAGRPIWLSDQAVSIEQIAALVGAPPHTPWSLVIIDYLQLIRAPKMIKDHRLGLEHVSQELKTLAVAYAVPILCLSSLARPPAESPNREPTLASLRECMVGGTLVQLADGRRVRIDSLVGTTPSVVSVSAQMKVITARASTVWAVGERDIVRVKLAGGRELRCTPDHRVMTGEGWARVGTLQRGDRVACARCLPEPPSPKVWPDHRVILLAHLIGDGCYLAGRVAYTTGSEENARTVRAAAVREFGSRVTTRPGKGHWQELTLAGNGNRWHHTGVMAWLDALGITGQRSHDKHVPDEVFTLSNRQVALFLRHLWATDGTLVVTHPTIGYSTSSRRLASDVMALLLRLGVWSRLTHITPKTSKGRGWSQVVVTGRDHQLRFLDVIGTCGAAHTVKAAALRQKIGGRVGNTNNDTLPPRFSTRALEVMRKRGIRPKARAFLHSPSRATAHDYAEWLDDDELRQLADSDLFWEKVHAVEPDGREVVYDMSIQKSSPCYLAEGHVVAHNSGEL